MKQFTITENLYNHSIQAYVTILDEGVHVLLTGGEKSHIGAISRISTDAGLQTMTFPDHKEDIISMEWTKKIFAWIYKPVVVAVGIHYDDVSKAQIEKIVGLTDSMLTELLQRLSI